ncbi:hypothetical protein Ahy_A04g017365 [Arachis hypogaea]|uniref:Ubiquitin-like protease family profile domain-containing protein n=1 Tax=Arachis hypogaea TaxID=3818 RepID=A0A445DAQ9_ARAHY|nr:hypothetical protein Ahy_A04g017365 [Arachis hypogaea]
MPQIFAPICYMEHWWLSVADVRKKKIYVLDPYHKTCPSEPIMKLNKFVWYVISIMRVYAGGTSQEHFRPPYVDISGKKIHYDCVVYVMKWLEIIQPQNIKKKKQRWTTLELNLLPVFCFMR